MAINPPPAHPDGDPMPPTARELTLQWRAELRANLELRRVMVRAALDGNLDACRYLLDQAWGKAPTTVRVDGMLTIEEAVAELRGFLAAKGLTDEWHRSLRQRSEALAATPVAKGLPPTDR